MSYEKVISYSDPDEWLQRIKAYLGVLEAMREYHEVASIEQINYRGEEVLNGVKYYFFNDGRRTTATVPYRLHKFVKALKPDVVFVHGLHFPLQVLQLRMMLGRAVPIIAQHHAEKPYNGIKKLFQRVADRAINAYLFTSQEMGEEWVKQKIIGQSHKIKGVMEASSTFTVTDKASAREITRVKGEPVYLWVGRLDANKDPLTAARAFLRFLDVQPIAKLYIIFQTEELLNELKTLIAKSDHANDIVLVGKKEHEEMQYWYNSADFIISSSFYEGSGVAVCEAMSCGCVPILTDILSFRKMTNEGRCGLLYRAGNAEALYSTLCTSLKLDYVSEREKVLEQFNRQLSFKAIAKEIDRVIQSLEP